ncbi:hypothetical protein F2Q69_00026351 [Brassica cretica]|uniref:Uncharacterized protein n=1 Tax=Brassica cretica TaxID=69181 RepID=A0A8S9RUQ4_BRACR|nr:hypothetical protein F2Q69_00026351 [Brassica cretica]
MGSSTSKTSSSASSTSLSSSLVTKLASDSSSPAIHKDFYFPTPLVHYPRSRKGDTHDLVSLTSTFYSSLLKCSSDQETPPRISIADKNTTVPGSHLEGQTDPDRADILWEASSVMKLVVTVLQQCCLECLVNPTVRSSLIELKFGRGVVDWFILDLYGGISLWLPESLDLQESKRQKTEKREGGRISYGFVKADLEGQTDPDRADILWEASSVMKLVVTVLQQCCLECLVNPTVRSSLIELKFGRALCCSLVVVVLVLEIALCSLSLCSVQVVE